MMKRKMMWMKRTRKTMEMVGRWLFVWSRDHFLSEPENKCSPLPGCR